jgi:hypothetical protein
VIREGNLHYDDVINLAGYRSHRHQNPSITWERPNGLGGILYPGSYITLEDGMNFRVDAHLDAFERRVEWSGK